MSRYKRAQGSSVKPPCYTIDLSLPPRQRYKALAREYASHLRSLTGLFNDLLMSLNLPKFIIPAINQISRLCLRKVHDKNQYEELQGIAQESRVPIYLLIAFNVVLDLLMGCTSGGVIARDNSRPGGVTKMLHFRTLDWGMDPLRQVIVQLNFIRSDSTTPEKVVASTITYVGFVGVLTGVRPGLSMSLNFRAVHDAASRKEHFRFYLHHLLVLLGRRPSIASLLRSYLLEGFIKDESEDTDADRAIQHLTGQHTTAAYLIFSDGRKTHVVEKDYDNVVAASSHTFITRTNHDVCDHASTSTASTGASVGSTKVAVRHATDIADFIKESKERLKCLERKWKTKVRKAQTTQHSGSDQHESNAVYVTADELVKWVTAWTTTNESTHFAAIMDPTEGQIVWCRAYPYPLSHPDFVI